MAFKRFEIDDIGSLEELNEGINDVLAEQEVEIKREDPELTILIRTNKIGTDDIRLFSAIIYYGATIPEITSDLNSRES